MNQLEVFRARAVARAILYRAGELDLHEAVDVLAADAVTLVPDLDADQVQAILADAFGQVRP